MAEGQPTNPPGPDQPPYVSPSVDFAAYKRWWRWDRKGKGVCTTCGGPRDVEGKVRCSACHEKDTQNYQRYGRAKYHGRSARVNGQAAEQRRQWDAEGKCNWCGGERDDPPRKRCRACNEYARTKLKKYAREKKAKGLCRCGKRPAPGRRKCTACLERVRTEYRKLMETNPAAVLAKFHRRRARKSGNGGSFTALEWQAIKRLQEFACLCCGRREPEIKLTVDHVIPVNRGGPSWAWNLQGLCDSCNKSKGDKHIDYRPNGPWIKPH
jgi:5-methylcytosine-specific restriction endonuclease McrA